MGSSWMVCYRQCICAITVKRDHTIKTSEDDLYLTFITRARIKPASVEKVWFIVQLRPVNAATTLPSRLIPYLIDCPVALWIVPSPNSILHPLGGPLVHLMKCRQGAQFENRGALSCPDDRWRDCVPKSLIDFDDKHRIYSKWRSRWMHFENDQSEVRI